MSKRIINLFICLILVFSTGCNTATSRALPRVVGAVSTGNKQVKVSFSEPMKNDAVNPANYSIVQINLNTNDSQLIVTEAKFADSTHTVVELTTLSQNEVRYQLTAISMRNRFGDPLAPKEVVAGVIVDPTSAVFQGTPPGPADVIDSDNDTISDSAEQRGWDVFVMLNDGHEISRHVTSDPNSADTDDDSIADRDEKAFGSDPRLADTDGDSLTDYQELNEIYSQPLKQDSDGDSLGDGLEFNLFGTSPIIADTDGDQFSDDRELLDLDRNPLIADLPRLQIFIGDARLSVNVVSTYTDETGTLQSSTETLQTTFGESSERRFGTSDTVSNETTMEYGQKIGTEVSYTAKDGFGAKGSFEASFGQTFANGFTSTVDRESAEVSSREYQDSVSRIFSQSQNRSVTRTVQGAQIVAEVSIQNLSDIAFTITNLELSVLRMDRRNSNRFVPVAALRLQGTASASEQIKFNLGPFDPERGPFIFENTSVYPNLVEELMREPQGLVYRVVNFDLLDEFGRNFVFSSQEVNDQTVGITIDFGGGEVEAYRVATHNVFDENGQMMPITMKRALEIIGICGYTEPDGDVPNADPNDPAILNSYGTQRDSDDGVEILTRIRGIQTDFASQDPEKRFWAVISANRGVPITEDFSSIELRGGDNFLLVFTRDIDKDKLFEREELFYGSSDKSVDTDGDSISDFDEVRTGWSVTVKGSGETKIFSSPASMDTDSDGLSDEVEMQFGTDPTREDTDFDGLSDRGEIFGPIELLLFDGDTDETNNPVLFVPRYEGASAIVNGFNGTSDTTATSDDVQEVAFGAASLDGQVVVSAGENAEIDTEPNMDQNGLMVPGGDDYVRSVHDQEYVTDPLNRDTDYDSLSDGREVIVGSNPNRQDAGGIVDGDNDGLTDNEEDSGWGVAVNGGTLVRITSDKFRADTDRDGIPDVYERAIGTNPRSRDTDGDTLLDGREFDVDNERGIYDALALAEARDHCKDASACSYEAPPAQRLTGTDPRKADTDGDGLADNDELTFKSDPTKVDTDADGLNDKEEVDLDTNPTKADTDGDEINDKIEADRGTDPSIKDKYLRFTFNSVVCTSSDDAFDASCACYDIDVHYNLYVKKQKQILVSSWSDEMGAGDTHGLGDLKYDYIIKQGESVKVYTLGVYDYDSGSGNENFENLDITYTLTGTYPYNERRCQNSDDGTICTIFYVEEILGVPTQKYLVE